MQFALLIVAVIIFILAFIAPITPHGGYAGPLQSLGLAFFAGSFAV